MRCNGVDMPLGPRSLDLNPYSDLSMLQKVLAQHPMTDTGSSDPDRGKKEQTVSMSVPVMTETVVSQHSGIPASGGNPVSSFQASDRDSLSSAPSG